MSPFDIRTPLRRVDFWTFYAGYCVLLIPVLIAIEGLLRIASQAQDSWLAVPILLSVLGFLLYLFCVFFTAMTRRLRDSGYRRMAVPVFLLTSATSFFGYTRAVVLAWQPGVPPERQAVPEIPDLSLWAALTALLSAGYIFYGLIRRSHAPEADDLSSDDAG